MGLLDEHDATGLAALVRAGEVHPRELVADAIARIEAGDGALNAVIHRQFERAVAEAERDLPDGALRGVPFLLKDYKGREAGERYQMGCRALAAIDYRPTTSSPVSLAFRRAGLVPLGRTNVPEMALMGTTEPALHGPTHNPWDLTRTPGGSSGGSAAAVAARFVPAAHATDISGSIRIPAAHCGLVGFKPTRGRLLKSAGDPPVGMDSEGVVTRSVRDTAALLDVLATTSAWWPAPTLPGPLAGELGADPGRLRVGLWVRAFNGADVDAGNADAARHAATLLASLGHHVQQSAPAALSGDDLWSAARDALVASAAAEADAWTARLGRPLDEADVEPGTWAQIAAGRAMGAPAVLHVIERLQAVSSAAQPWWDDFDLLVTPTTAGPPTELGEYTRAYVSGRGSAFTRPFNVTGQPAVSLPLGWPADGLPRGVQLVAAYGRDDLLVRVAAQLEAAAPWAHRVPPASDRRQPPSVTA